MEQQGAGSDRPRYTWPRYVLGGVLLGLVLAIIWLSVLVHRIREERVDNPWQSPPSQTSSPAGHTNPPARQ